MLAILLTPPTSVPGEAATLAALCGPSATTRPPAAVHVRKPGWPRARLEAYVRGLDPAVRDRVVLHSHHDLVGELGLRVSACARGCFAVECSHIHMRPATRPTPATAPTSPPYPLSSPSPCRQGIHYTETLRAAGPVIAPLPGCTISASLHALADVPRGDGGGGSGDATPAWTYAFLSPVWPSVSKPGHGGPGSGCALTPPLIAADLAARPPSVPVVALGGLTLATAPEVAGLGCAGGAALGAVWEAPDRQAAWAAIVAGLDAGEERGRGSSAGRRTETGTEQRQRQRHGPC
jgi:thiamine-phosphate pyrophosphorylase